MFWKHRSTTCRDCLLTQVPKKAALLPGFAKTEVQVVSVGLGPFGDECFQPLV
jgi:hypothetical protein